MIYFALKYTLFSPPLSLSLPALSSLSPSSLSPYYLHPFSVGVDMTPSQLAVAEQTKEWHKTRFGYHSSNTEFKLGQIERLDQLNLQSGSFDVIISNCVINLCTDKRAVLLQAYNLLKCGGELYFSDVYSTRRIPQVTNELTD